jgi:hypothetical protein
VSNDLTLREVRLCREAYERGTKWCHVEQPTFLYETVTENAKRLYPMPTVEVPRVVEDESGHRWRLFAGLLQFQRVTDPTDLWFDTHGGWTPQICVERVLTLSQLLANPTHRVPADEVPE